MREDMMEDDKVSCEREHNITLKKLERGISNQRRRWRGYILWGEGDGIEFL
jgi:hypothetical protein